MPRRNPSVRGTNHPARANHARQAERDRKRRRLAAAKSHPNRNVNPATYKELSA